MITFFFSFFNIIFFQLLIISYYTRTFVIFLFLFVCLLQTSISFKTIIKIEKASEMQQPSCKSNSFGQTGFLFSRFINVMCQISIFWHCWFTRRRFLNIKIINHFRPPLGPFFGPQTYRT
jgi:hypothetical protein